MTGRGAIAVIGAACGASLGLFPGWAAAEPPRQTAKVAFTTTTPAAPTGLSTSVDWTNPSDPSAKPYAVDKVLFRYAPGVAIDFGVPDQCKASDAQLEADGAAACPPGSRVATGTIVTDSGASGGPFPRFVDVKVDNFNNQGELIGVGDATNVPVIPGFTRTVTRSPIVDGSFTTDFPDVPTGSPPDGYDALKSLRISGAPIVRGGHAYLRTPSTCPPSGVWTNSLTFVYHDGVTQTVNSDSPCVGRSSPALTVHAEPEHRCAARRFSVRALIFDAGPLRRVEVLLDRRRVLTTTRNPFRLHLPVRRLRPGAHHIEVVASNVAGWTARKRVRLTRCR